MQDKDLERVIIAFICKLVSKDSISSKGGSLLIDLVERGDGVVYGAYKVAEWAQDASYFQHHLSLILRNLTTNEDMNKHRFAYLRNELNQFHNPFSTGACGNLREVCSRRRTVLENPYVYSERFRALASGDGDIERTEKDGDSERASMMRHTQDEH